MTPEQLEQMRGYVTDPKIDAKTAKVTCNDGDILEGFIEFVCDEERDVVFQLQSSSNPAKYKRGTNYVQCPISTTSMISLCQEGKSSPGALRRSAGTNPF